MTRPWHFPGHNLFYSALSHSDNKDNSIYSANQASSQILTSWKQWYASILEARYIMCLVLSVSHSSILCWRKIALEQHTYPRSVYLEQNGDLFQFVLDYLQNNGHVLLLLIVCKEDFLAEFGYLRITDVDKSKIFQKNKLFNDNAFEKLVMQAEVSSWIVDRTIVTHAHKCASAYLKSALHKRVTILGLKIIKLSQNNSPTIIRFHKNDVGKCFLLTWMA